jgi:type III secretion protein T
VELDYVQLLLRGNEHLGSVLSVGSIIFLAVGRIGPIIGMTPFFGGKILPNSAKFAMAFCFAVMIVPQLIFSFSRPVSFNFELMMLMVREVFIGSLLAFFMGLPFSIVSSAGVFIDHQRGAASLMTNDPTVQNQSSPIGTLYNMLLITIFWAIGGPFYVLDTIFYSYQLIPPDRWEAPLFLFEHSDFHIRVLHALQIFATLSLQLAMPALLAILMTDTFLGIINRLAPQVQITFLGMGFKSWFALLVICLGFYPFVTQLTKQVENWLKEFQEIVVELRYPEKPQSPTSMPSAGVYHLNFYERKR